MPHTVAFLRAVNVGGRVVKMDELRRIFAELGCRGVETFIASGNVIFETSTRTESALRKRIEEGLEKALGYDVETFLRTDAEVAGVAASFESDLFPKKLWATAHACNVGFLHAPLPKAAVATLAGYTTDADVFATRGREWYWLSQTRFSESPFFKVPAERRLGVRTTLRNLNTVRKLAAKYPADARRTRS